MSEFNFFFEEACDNFFPTTLRTKKNQIMIQKKQDKFQNVLDRTVNDLISVLFDDDLLEDCKKINTFDIKKHSYYFYFMMQYLHREDYILLTNLLSTFQPHFLAFVPNRLNKRRRSSH